MRSGRIRLRRRAAATFSVMLVLVVACLCLVGCDGDMTGLGISPDEGETLEERVASGLSVSAQRGSGTLEIARTTPTGARPQGIEKDTWTVFIYLCGSDLETQSGAATADLGEMVGARGSENVQFVVETGGAKKWRGDQGSGKKLDRYVVQDGAISKVDSVKSADMGDPNTLADFLTWGLKNYPAEHMGVILWDHGGGSISGVCFDELNDSDSLLLRELDLSFAMTNTTLWQKFDFVGFDACLMGTLETANVLAAYSDYMVASQELEPGTGWEYSSIMEYLARHPSCDGRELGQSLCDSYMDSLSGSAAGTATLALVDLAEVDDLMQDFYRFSQEMYESGADQGTLAAMTRGIRKAECYGSNSWLEGYTNMVDLGGIVSACAGVTPSAADVQASLKKTVAYQVTGRNHRGSSGLSVYYPLSVNNANELTAFQTVAVNPSYLSYVDRLAHGATYSGGSQPSLYTNYTDSDWYDADGLWSLLMDDESFSALLGMRSADPRWEYVNDHDGTSEVVSFAAKPQVDDEGVYWMQFDEEGVQNVASVSGLVYRQGDGGSKVELGETYEVYADWDEGADQGMVEDGFDGKWLSLPDGQNLCLYVVESTVDEAVFTSPIRLNDKDCYLRMHQDLKTGEVEVEGTWAGIGENGLANRSCTPLVEGDVIVPLYGTDGEVAGNEYAVPAEGLTIAYGALPEGTYFYSFNITDVYGDRLVTDPVQFDVEKDGIYFVG